MSSYTEQVDTAVPGLTGTRKVFDSNLGQPDHHNKAETSFGVT